MEEIEFKCIFMCNDLQLIAQHSVINACAMEVVEEVIVCASPPNRKWIWEVSFEINE